MEKIMGRRGVKRLTAVILAVMLGLPGAIWGREATGVTQAKERVANTAQQSKSNVQKLKRKKGQQLGQNSGARTAVKKSKPKGRAANSAAAPMKPMRSGPVGTRAQ